VAGPTFHWLGYGSEFLCHELTQYERMIGTIVPTVINTATGQHSAVICENFIYVYCRTAYKAE